MDTISQSSGFLGADRRESPTGYCFSKRQTQIMKGIAIFLLLVHHSLPPVPVEYLGAWVGVVNNSISIAKLCVAIFALLSGYGMYLSFDRREKSGTKGGIWRFVLTHIWKLYSTFWLTALVAIGCVSLLRGNFGEIYQGHPLYYAFLDIMGLSYLTGTPKFVNSWWYVTATLIYYCLFPLLFLIVKRLNGWNWVLLAVLAAASFGPQRMNSIMVYGCFFVYGMMFAERDAINRFLNILEENRLQRSMKGLGCLFVLIGLCVFRQMILAGTKTEYYLDWLIALVLILLVSQISRHRKSLRAGLLELTGRYSFEIYLIHGVFLKYFGTLIYRSVECWAVLLRLFVLSFLAALLLRGLEQGMRVVFRRALGKEGL